MKPMHHDPLIAARKAELRQRLAAARGAIPAPDRQRRAGAIVSVLRRLDAVREARTVFAYLSNGPEVHTHDLVRELMQGGKEVFVPKIVAKTQMLACRLRDWSRLKPAQLGILTPIDMEAFDGPFDVAITPGLGFSPRGERIGFGAGYYDRWLAAHAVKLRIAVAFEAQIVEDLPTTGSDQPVDLIVTEQRLIETGARPTVPPHHTNPQGGPAQPVAPAAAPMA